MATFAELYRRLNSAQKQAVDTIEGPVMVIAGPGTGKTQTLAMRVANILQKTQMRPSQILCLTFSSSGATAMRDRLRSLIGPDAYGVTVSTIHGFCQSIIDAHPQVFEQFSMQEKIGEIEKYRELNAIIDSELTQSALINPKDPYGRDGDLLSRFSQVKREGKTMADLEKALVELSAETEAKNARARTESGRQKNLAVVEKYRSFIRLYTKYQDMLRAKGKYDYDDMILFVLQALREHDWLLAGLQERYQYILLDEAQDTNGSQWQVIERLTTYDELPHEPNLFIVGDDDQAIYRFQGANLQNMLSFHRRFPTAPIITLTTSYRSTPAILAAAESLISKNEERLVGVIPGLTKHLESGLDAKDIVLDLPFRTAPTLLRSASDAAEPWLLADLIEARLQAGIEPAEVAVLTQTNNELFPLYDVLKARGIPAILHGKADLMSHPLIREAFALLAAAESPSSNAYMISALATTSFGCHPADLSRLSFAAREKKLTVHEQSLALETESSGYLKAEALIAARDAVLEIVHHAETRTVIETVERVLRLVAGVADRHDPLNLAAIEAFFHYAKAACLEQPALSFSAFMSDLSFYRDPEYGQARLSYELPHLVQNGVQLLTAHQSKGLEFHTVILANFRDGHWDKRRKPSGVSLPEDVLFGWETDQKKFEQHQDERRLAFVAMTRAKRELLMVCPNELSVGEKHKSVSPSAFFAEAGTLPEEQAVLQEPAKASLMLLNPTRELDSELQAYLRTRLENYALSATSLARFLRDPQEFLLVDLLGQPEHFDEGSTRSLGYGSAVHWALREWATARVRGEEFTVEQLLQAFAWYLQERTILTKNQRADLLHMGQQALPKYFAERLQGSTPILYAIEKDYRARVGDIPLKGKIDRIDQLSPNSGHVQVIDYKTGAAKTIRDIRGGLETGTVSRTEEGDRFRQLVFYALLLEQGDPLITPASFALEFIGERGEAPERVEVSVVDSEKDALRQLIQEVWQKITALDFTPLEQGRN